MSEEPKIVLVDRVITRNEIEETNVPNIISSVNFWGPIHGVIKAAEEAGISWDRVYARYWILEVPDPEG